MSLNKKSFSNIWVLIGMGILAIGLPTSLKLVQQIQETRSKAAGGKSYGEACSINGDCASGLFCTYDQSIGGHKYNFINNTAVCSVVGNDSACVALGGNCDSSLYTNSVNNNAASCTTSSGLSGTVVLNLCLSSSGVGKRCCVPIKRCDGNNLKTVTYNSNKIGITVATNTCTGGCSQSGGNVVCNSTCTSWTYSDWSACSNGTQTRTVLTSSPSGCTGGSPVTSQSCTVTPNTCTSWTYSDWSACSNGTQTRTVLTSSPSGCTGGSPVTSQNCNGDTRISFKVSFAGVTPSMACLSKFQTVKLLVGRVGTSTTQELTANLTSLENSENNGLQVYEADDITLNNSLFSSSSNNNFVKIKGWAHARMAYCENNQNGSKSIVDGCNIALNGNLYDFSNYVILAGDINQDGVINSIDFSLVKSNLSTDQELEEARNGNVDCTNNYDLNGDGVVNNLDINLVKNSLSYKDDEN